MEQQTENKEKAPCFDIDKFTEDTREALLVLNLHYFSKIMEENEKLKQTKFFCKWSDSMISDCPHIKIVYARNKKEVRLKILTQCNESIEIIQNEYDNKPKKEIADIKKWNVFNKLIALDLLHVKNLENDCYYWCLPDDVPEFSKRWKEFLVECLDDAIYVLKSAEENGFINIEKIDKKHTIY